MREGDRLQAGASILDNVVVRPIGLDDWSDVRYVHAASFRMLVDTSEAPRAVESFNQLVTQPEYVDAMRSANLAGAWLGGELVGTVGWVAADDRGATARIVGLFVRPLFTMMGIGTLLLGYAEQAARGAGFARFSARASSSSVPFFEMAGYDISSYGAYAIDGARELKVVFLRKADQARAAYDETGPRAAFASKLAGPVPATDGLVFDRVPMPQRS